MIDAPSPAEVHEKNEKQNYGYNSTSANLYEHDGHLGLTVTPQVAARQA